MGKTGRLWATIDRIEQDEKGRRQAVLVFDDGQQLVVPVETLPSGATPNQVLQVSIRVDHDETARRTAEIGRLQRELFGE